jgi:hypothetical protein
VKFDGITSAPVRPIGDQPEHILQFFDNVDHSAPMTEVVLQEMFKELAHQIVRRLPRNSERTVALRKLLESKDAAVRVGVAK